MILVDPQLDAIPAPPHPLGAKLPSVRTLARFLTEAQTVVRLRGEVTVLLTTDAAMRDLNRRFRRKNKPTDVLSFPAANLIQSEEKGDLAISVERALKQSAEQGHALAVEIKVLILHGLLHLAGYDHETDSGQMQRRERSLRAKLCLPQGLIERTRTEHKLHPKLRSTARGASPRDTKPQRGKAKTPSLPARGPKP